MQKLNLTKQKFLYSIPGGLLTIIGLGILSDDTTTAILMIFWGAMLTPVFWALASHYFKRKFRMSHKFLAFFIVILVISFIAPDRSNVALLDDPVTGSRDTVTAENLILADDNDGFDNQVVDVNLFAEDNKEEAVSENYSISTINLIPVVSVTDGDTLKVNINGKVETIRVIGINTPETVHPSKPVECFGREASVKAKELLTGTRVIISYDDSQGMRDKYDRLLAYITLADGRDFSETMIKEGFAYEYTYNIPYQKQTTYKAAQTYAQTNELGLWADGACGMSNTPEASVITVKSNTQAPECNIKGNISVSGGEKIYHVPGQQNYTDTIINESKGESWFCSEDEAVAAGWRKALR